MSQCLGDSGKLRGVTRIEQAPRLARIAAEANEQGVFGVPTFILDGELFWGHDRVALLRERLAGG